ncbi:hypothetical protein Tco_0917859 [Tanacetum coccineum]
MKFSFLSAIKRYKLEGGYCMVEHVNSLASELASTTANERSKLDQCKDLLSMLTHMEVIAFVSMGHLKYLFAAIAVLKSEPYLGGASLIFVVVSVGHLKYLFAAVAVLKSEPYLCWASLICLSSLGNLLFLSMAGRNSEPYLGGASRICCCSHSALLPLFGFVFRLTEIIRILAGQLSTVVAMANVSFLSVVSLSDPLRQCESLLFYVMNGMVTITGREEAKGKRFSQ